MITASKVMGYCSGMSLLVFNVEQGCYYWELVIGAYFDIQDNKKSCYSEILERTTFV